MRYETLMYIVRNKRSLLYNDATGTGGDSSTDPSAAGVNPNAYLVGDIGSARVVRLLLVVLLILAIIYLFKRI